MSDIRADQVCATCNHYRNGHWAGGGCTSFCCPTGFTLLVPEVIIVIGDATPYLISAPHGMRVVIRDYDVPPGWNAADEDETQPPGITIRRDDDGLTYQEIILS